MHSSCRWRWLSSRGGGLPISRGLETIIPFVSGLGERLKDRTQFMLSPNKSGHNLVRLRAKFRRHFPERLGPSSTVAASSKGRQVRSGKPHDGCLTHLARQDTLNRLMKRIMKVRQ